MLDTVKRESIYQPEQRGLKFPEIPSFATPAQERRHRQECLVAACRAFALHGLDYGFAGHLTVRDPERPHLYWTSRDGGALSQVKCSNLILADRDGRVLEGKHAINRAGFVLHAAVHEHHADTSRCARPPPSMVAPMPRSAGRCRRSRRTPPASSRTTW